ncbi:DMT family transporter [Pseudoramibacter sp.]|jgi:drug/metabolite transporter (DMT)-like permease|uniref:DMT family transporter n=1 Tax=Pseudoramibacter sp. TaxID=2034862 RepID=UPI0025EEEDE1|nr:DMT family transporter [Pseudoramibacter sp.]MCH4071612.1 DMT family transporter [Pseudoramibacter sp.]MCH4105380.1 DMT family transporter [Pseudoramibacter sp.]
MGFDIRNRRHAEGLLAAVIFARSTSFLLVKRCLTAFAVFNLLAVRFSIAAVILIAIFRGYLKNLKPATLARGAVLGAVFFAVMAGETIALSMTSSSTTALVESAAIMLVPFFVWLFFRRRPTKANVAAAAVAFAGVSFTICQTGRLVFSAGILWCLATAVLYALSVIVTDRLSKQDDPIALGVIQVAVMALGSVICTLLFEHPTLSASPGIYGNVIYLAVVCSVFGFAIQPYAQSGTTPERASLFLAITPAAATVLGVVFLKETLTALGAVGVALILASFFIANRRG